MVLDSLPRDYRPIVQVIDDWNTNRRLGLLWECRVGQGRLLVCSADLHKDLDKRPAARQLRASLLRYMAGKGFRPKLELTPDALHHLLVREPSSKLAKLGAKVMPRPRFIAAMCPTFGENRSPRSVGQIPPGFKSSISRHRLRPGT